MAQEGGEAWQPIETAPKDGRRILAWAELTFDEEDEDGAVIRRGAKDHYAVIIYYLSFGGISGGFVEFPYRGSIVQNQRFTHWQPLPAPPSES